MKQLKNKLHIIALLILVLLFAGCAKTDKNAAFETITPKATEATTPNQSTAVAVTDMAGQEISLAAPATKVVALDAADCEILYALGAGDTLVGRGEYCDYPAAVADVTAVQSGSETNIEQIIALKPQVVLMSKMAQTTEQVETLKKAGIAVVVMDAQDLEGIYQSISLAGAIVGKNREAENIVAQMKASFDEIKKKVAGAAGKTIYFEVSPMEYGLWAAGNHTFMNELAQMLGLENIFSDVEGWGEVSQEQVIERNPDYIVTITMYDGKGEKPEEEIMKRKGWNKIKAVTNKAVYNADSNEISRPGPRLVDAANALYSFLYE